MIPRIISVSNLKGGAGKSTIAVNIACAIRERTGIDTILVDADRQATALKWAETGALGIRVTSRVLHEAKPEERHPGLMWVTQIRMLADKNPSVVIDLPPGLEYSLAAVAAISDMILVPVNPSGVDFHSTSAFINLVQKTRQIRHSDKPRSIIVPNRLDRRTAIARKMSLYEQFGEPISPPIGMRSAFVYAFDHGQWVGDFAPRSVAHKEIEQLITFIMSGGGKDDAAAAPPAAVEADHGPPVALTRPKPAERAPEAAQQRGDPAPDPTTEGPEAESVAADPIELEQPPRPEDEGPPPATAGGAADDLDIGDDEPDRDAAAASADGPDDVPGDGEREDDLDADRDEDRAHDFAAAAAGDDDEPAPGEDEETGGKRGNGEDAYRHTYDHAGCRSLN